MMCTGRDTGRTDCHDSGSLYIRQYAELRRLTPPRASFTRNGTRCEGRSRLRAEGSAVDDRAQRYAEGDKALAHGSLDARCIEPQLREQLRGFAVFNKLVRQPQAQHRSVNAGVL